ncbi:MAG: caspase family protein [Bacteroidales bacterium]|nr:caspase family protein [Bacteroidales bacterium]
MKKLLLIMAVMILSMAAKAQQLYELKYYDRDDKCTYIGLFFFTSEEDCYLRCVDEKPNAKGEYEMWESDYESGFGEDEDGRYIYFVPKESKTEDGYALPWFTQGYNSKGEFDGPASVVFQDWNDEVIHKNNVRDCEYFTEVDITKKDRDYFLEFFNEDDEMFERIMDAKERLNNQDRELDGQYTNSNNKYEGDVTMHFIVVAATNDESIGESVQTDLKLVRKDFSIMADQLNIGFDEQIVQGSQFNKRNIEKVIDNVNVKPNDLIVFIYSGHGFRYDDDQDAFPRMYLAQHGENPTDEYQLSTTDAFKRLAKKNARLTLFLSDCCNSEVGATRMEMESMAFASRAVNNNIDTKKLRQLFIDQEGTLRATAAKAGQYALCDRSGGYLLTSFLNNIKAQVSAISKDDPSWKRIMDNAERAVAKKTSNQIDEAGNETEPQRVVKAVNLNPLSPSSSSDNNGGNGSYKEDNMRESVQGSRYDKDDNYDYDDDFYFDDDDEESIDEGNVLVGGLLCIGLPIVIVLLLIIIIIKLLKKKKE